jgi:hypothetical protein
MQPCAINLGRNDPETLKEEAQVLDDNASVLVEDVTELSWEDLVLDLIDDPEHLVDSTGGSSLNTGCQNTHPDY